MGVDAIVGCRCHVDGTAATPPFPVFFGPDGLQPEGERSLEELIAFDRWKLIGCPHEDMVMVHERIGTWGYFGEFYAAVRREGVLGDESDHLATLIQELPQSNSGMTSPECSQRCFDDLDVFEATWTPPLQAQLVDPDSDVKIASRARVYNGFVLRSGRDQVNVLISAAGTLIVRRSQKDDIDIGQILFEASEFTQVADPRRNAPDRVRLASADGQTITLSSALPHPQREAASDRPMRFEVVAKPLDSDFFAPMLTSLRTVFTASVDTGRPVEWC